MNLYINASMVATAIGKNRYRKPTDALQQVLVSWFRKPTNALQQFFKDARCSACDKPWDQCLHLAKALADVGPYTGTARSTCAPQDFLALAAEPDVCEKLVREALPLPTHVREAIVTELCGTDHDDNVEEKKNRRARTIQKAMTIASTEAVEAPNSREAEAGKASVADTVARALSAGGQSTHIPAVRRCIKSTVNTCRGINLEKPQLDAAEKRLAAPIIERNSCMYYTTIRFTDGGSFRIGGRVDGIIKGSGGQVTIVESKNRMKRFFDNIPIYERVQMELYLRMVPNADKVILTENLDDGTRDRVVRPDDDLFEDIKRGLETFHGECTMAIRRVP